MFTAHIDTPWLTLTLGGENVNVPALAHDSNFFAEEPKWVDVTGSDGVEVEPGRILYGGNYAKATGIQPDYSVGRLGGSGDPDWLTIKVTVPDEALLQSIDADDKYWVYWDEVVEEEAGPVVLAASYKPKDSEPPVQEWGDLRSKLARRGYSQAWIDANLGTQRERMRGEHDANMRNGYTVNQLGPVQHTILTVLESEGWATSLEDKEIIVTRSNGDRHTLLLAYLMGCDYSDLPTPLANDLMAAMQTAGYCL